MQNIFFIAKNISMYFNYHAKIKQLIKQKHLINILYFKNYNNITPAIVFVFNNHKPMPIRSYRWQEYCDFLKQNCNKKF